MTKDPAFIILAAGKGTRLGGAVPKPLTKLPDGRTILEQQLSNIEFTFGASALKRTRVVVGHRAEEVVETLPREVKVVYNTDYDTSNTAHSLSVGLSAIPKNESVIWLNGDVVFSPLIFGRIGDLQGQNFMAVVPGLCSEEEMKYSLDAEGLITKVSKSNTRGVGEAVGINQIASHGREQFSALLKDAKQQDYFEAAIEESLRKRELNWFPLDTSGLHALEIDFAEDLERVNKLFA